MGLLLMAFAAPPVQADDVTICDDTESSEFLPIGGYYLDMTGCFGQIIYPATTLGLSSGDEITAITFYANSNFTASNNITVRVGETTETTVTSSSATTNRDNMNVVYTGSLPTGSTEVTITFSEPYTYNGNNLIIDMYRNSGTGYCSYGFKWYGVTGNSVTNYYYSGNSYNGQSSFMPKAKITYDAGELVDYAAKVTPESLAFGQIKLGQPSTLNVTLRNSGANAFTPSVTINGTGFSTTYTSAELSSKTSVDIPVTFSPTAAGEFTGTLTINCGNAGTFTVDLTGAAVLEETVCDENTTTSNFLPIYGYYYDNKQINQMIYPAEILTNLVGKNIKSLTFYTSHEYFSGGKYDVALGMTNQAEFESTPVRITGLTTVATNKVAVAGDTVLNIVFDEGFEYTGGNLVIDFEVTEVGSYGSYQTPFKGENQSTNTSFNSYGSSINSNGTYSATVRQFLPQVKFAYEVAAGSVSVNPASLNFNESDTYAGGSYQKTFTVTNTTDEAVNITMTGDNVFTFSPATVAAGATETITVTYAPTAVGNNSATLTVGDKTVTLAGTAVAAPAPTITVNPATVTINTQTNITGSATFTVTGTNLNGDITVTASEGFTVSPTTIAATNGAASATVTVTCTAQEAGTFNGNITLTSTDAETVTVPVTANVVDPVISGTVTPTTLNLTSQEGTTTTGTITVENTGNTAFTPTFSTLTAPFSIEAATEIAVGASKQFTVTYAPATAGNHNATLTVTINGQATNVTLNGTATEAPEGGELTVAESTSTSAANLSSIAPIYGANYNKTGWVQMLYPASLLSDLNGKQITKVTFRHNGAPYFSGGAVEVKIGETVNSDLSSSVAESTLKAVATVSPIGNAFDNSYYLTFEFTTPYVYNGGNLVIQTKVTTTGTNDRSKFYGKSTSQLGLGNITTLATSYSASTGSGYSTSFLPQATFTYEKVAGVIVEPADGTLAFGEVSTTGSKTLYVTVDNKHSVAVPVSVSTPEAPFSCSYTDTEIPASSTVQIPIRFAPTEGIDYSGTFTVTVNNVDYTFTLTGTGHVNQPTMGEDDFAAITYTWTDANGDEHPNTPMTEVATSAEQMVALMKAVYTNPNVPGNKYRGYTAAGEKETDLVSYPAIGTVSNYDYSDSYGWGIPKVNDLYKQGSSYYLNPTDYLPNEEGLTVLLVEMNDQAVAEAKAQKYGLSTTISGSSDYQSTSSYTDLVNKFDVMFKSVRVLTSSKNIGAGETGGTLFKIDCDKMNRFFLLGKGRLRTYYSDNVKMPDGNGNSYQVMTSTDVNMGPFYQMFEQFSPNVASASSTAETDIYQKLVNMESYGVLHDCVSVPTIDGHHEFNLYGVESISDDCQDVRDMMLFIPERRMTQWSDNSLATGYNKRDNSDIDHYVNYYRENDPKLGLFVIKQYPIDGEQIDGQDTYRLHLTWTSNLLDFLPGEDGQYTLYRVVTNEDGSKSYVAVADNLDPNTFEYYDNVPMQQVGQEVTYVVRGQDKEQFLTLQMSNEESFIIPGLDKAEQLRMSLNKDYYYSRFDPQTASNYYSNRFIISNNIGTNIKTAYVQVGSEFKFWRIPNISSIAPELIEEYVPAAQQLFATATVTSMSNGVGTMTIAPNTELEGYWDGTSYIYGYKACPTTATFTYNNNDDFITFTDFRIYDNFSVSVAGNQHPNSYGYYVSLVTAQPFDVGDGETSNNARSNSIVIPTHKTSMRSSVYNREQIDTDIDHALPIASDFDIYVKQSSKSEILGYYAYRWDSTYGTAEKPYAIITGSADNEQDVSPNGQAGNQGEFYTVAMNQDYTSQVNFTNGATTAWAKFVDNFIHDKADVYTYAPVVEVFAPAAAVEEDGNDREDYNTYGASLQNLASGKVTITPGSVVGSNYTFKPKYFATETNLVNGTDTATCCYYFIPLTLEVNIPDGYEIYKVRAWRLADTKWLGEVVNDYSGRIDDDYLYQTLDEPNKNEDVIVGVSDIPGYPGSTDATVQFGAKKLGTGESFDVDFIVRTYFTKKATRELTSADGKYYIAESKVKVTVTDKIITGVTDVKGEKQVAGVKYYNLAGMESDRPFNGVNIVVTRYTDGSISTSKVLK